MSASEIHSLFQAVIDDSPDTVRFLVQSEVKIDQKDRYGFSPVVLAQSLGRTNCLAHLQPQAMRTIRVRRRESGFIDALTVDEFEAWSGLQYASFAVARHVALLRVASRQCWKGRQKEGSRTERRWLAAWHASELAASAVCGTVIQWIDSHIGYGLFAYCDLPAWSYVGIYAGLLRRRDFFSLYTNDYCFRYPSGINSLRPLVIDAELMGNELRYANHSDRPNMEGIGVPYGPIVQVVFRTNRLVKRGEQLTYDYGGDYWKNREKTKKLL